MTLTPLMELAIILATGVIAAYIALKFKLPSMVGYILAGLFLSIFLPLIGVDGGLNSEFTQNLAELGVALLLFAAGIEFSLNNLRKQKNLVIAGSIIETIFVIVCATFIMQAFGLNSYEAFFVGVVTSSSSTAFVLKMLEQKEEIKSQQGRIMIGWLLMQDIMIVALFLLIKTFAPNSKEAINIFDPIIRSIIVIGVTFGLGRKVIPPIMSQIAKVGSQELLLISVVALSIGLSLFAEVMGVSFTLGAFLAGLALAETFLQHEIFAETKPMRDLFTMIFFVSIGSLFEISTLKDNIVPLIGIVLLIIPLKILIVFYLNSAFKIHTYNSIRVSFGIFQIGEFAFLAISIGLTEKWINSSMYSLILIAAIITMTLTPFIYNFSDETYRFLQKRLRAASPRLYKRLFINYQDSKLDEEELEDHIIICGYGKVGRYVAKAVSYLKEPFVVIDVDANLVQKGQEEGDRIIFGDSINRDVLMSANIKKAKIVVITLPQKATNALEQQVKLIKELNPKAEIILRGSLEGNNIDEMMSHTIEPEFEAAVGIVMKLEKMQHIRNSVVRSLRSYRTKELKRAFEEIRD